MKAECWHRWETTVVKDTITKVCKYCRQTLKFRYPMGIFPKHVRRYLDDEATPC